MSKSSTRRSTASRSTTRWKSNDEVGNPWRTSSGASLLGPGRRHVDGEDPVAAQGQVAPPGLPRLGRRVHPSRRVRKNSRTWSRAVAGRRSRPVVEVFGEHRVGRLLVPVRDCPSEESSSTPTKASPSSSRRCCEAFGGAELVAGEAEPEHAGAGGGPLLHPGRVGRREPDVVAAATWSRETGREGWLSTGATTTSSTIMPRANPPVKHMPTAPTPGPPHRCVLLGGQGPEPADDRAGPPLGQHGELAADARPASDESVYPPLGARPSSPNRWGITAVNPASATVAPEPGHRGRDARASRSSR